jgi:polyisoprenoid-binding protein YceI
LAPADAGLLLGSAVPEITITVDDVAIAVSGVIEVSATVAVRDTATTVQFNAHWHAPERGTKGAAMLHVSGPVDRRELGVRPRRPVDWVVGREVHLEAQLLLQPAW